MPAKTRIHPATSAPATAWSLPTLPWLTVEHLAYALLVALGLFLRLPNLGAQPLSPAEASTALRAWQASQGLGPTLDAGVPLLFSLQTLHFWLVGGASDALARTLPLLAAAALPLFLYPWRRWLGRATALLAAILVTFSPLINAFARRGDGLIFVLLALALALDGWQRLRRGEVAGWNRLAAGLGLILIAGPAAPTALLALGLILLLDRPLARPLPAPGAGAISLLAGVFLVGGSAFLTRLDALGLMALNWSTWLEAWSSAPGQWLWGLIRLFLDEPLLFSLGLAGIVWGWRRARAGRVLGLAALLACFVALFQGMYASESRAVAALLLAVPAADFLLWLAGRIWPRRREGEGLLLASALLAFAIVALFALIRFSYNGDLQAVLLALLVFFVSLIVIAVFAYFIGRRPALIFTAAALAVVVALFNLAMLWGLAFDIGAPRLPALYEGDGRVGVRDLVRTIGDISERQQGERWALALAFVPGSGFDDLLRWYLRPEPDLHIVSGVGAENAPPLVVAPASLELPLSERYAGSDFAIVDAWTPATAPPNELVEWLLFRTAPWQIPTKTVVLWADAGVLSLQ